MDLGLLILRTTVGLTLAAHGAQKLFGWFGGPGLEKAAEGFAMLGFVPGRRHALNAGVVEASGGLLLAAGLFTPLAATLVASVMFVAAVAVHWKRGFFIMSGGYEYNLVLGVAGLTLAFTGPGAFSVDGLAGTAVQGAVWGVGAALASVAGGALQLSTRRTAPAATAASAA